MIPWLVRGVGMASFAAAFVAVVAPVPFGVRAAGSFLLVFMSIFLMVVADLMSAKCRRTKR